MPNKKRTKNFIFEVFRIYRVQRFIFILFGLILIAGGTLPIVEGNINNSHIKTFGDGLWFAFVTATSTGYGDMVPHSYWGKFISVVLMFSGMTLFSTTVALVASYFSHRRLLRDTKKVDRKLEDIEEKIVNIQNKINYLVRNDIDEIESCVNPKIIKK